MSEPLESLWPQPPRPARMKAKVAVQVARQYMARPVDATSKCRGESIVDFAYSRHFSFPADLNRAAASRSNLGRIVNSCGGDGEMREAFNMREWGLGRHAKAASG